MFGDVGFRPDITAVQTFVEQHIGLRVAVAPWRQRAALLSVWQTFFIGVDVFAHLATPALTESSEGIGQLRQQIGIRTEMAEVAAGNLVVFFQLGIHLAAFITMHGIALDHLRANAVAPEDMLETVHHRRGAGAGGTGYRNHWVFSRHGGFLSDYI